ncbi:MAG: 2,3-bisphosphoglycerate-dependent phosphoglycerate mutase [Bifidobacterium aquikefiri]|uniref:2,3-bisphosphoglycerate-dependent phosphoglycerate mutase n=3 Tax=Bifidobacterium aquikefiri TaxID=1653207 RepID=A0A261G755_9BIFI|nr:2,3-bisphosphoglycerate-dependent phosphoglycerate mutase [Bifidobacterium aquikefiri]OZG67015.1 phosphoglyceromutase [Bifidobacterium aquikefiri]
MLIIMRHGQSTWTDKSVNRFAGWVDIPLTHIGTEQAEHAGELLQKSDLKPDFVFTSLLRRSIVTADIVLDAIDRSWIPVQRSWRLNERHYGAFQGETRPAMHDRYGDKLFATYRRSYDVRPPVIDVDSPFFQGNDPRYGSAIRDGLDDRDPSTIRTECLKDLAGRLQPYWDRRVAPMLVEGKTVLIVTHGSVVRAIVKMLEHISDADIRSINVPTGVPMIYDFMVSSAGKLRVQGPGQYLDPKAAEQGIAEVSALGQSKQ